ncbi:MAG: dihydropteroate synthase [Gemmatimonadetes bacterium]|nr:dihydropteroate synthase [Gemmatimonadota bacterium]
MHVTSSGPSRVWSVRDRDIPLDVPAVAGILNVTPDSFSDGGVFADPGRAIDHALEMVDDGAALIDVGAESTRPGSDPVPADLEWSRLDPVLAGLRDLPVPFTVDTTKSEVAERALDAGAAAINDVSGLASDPRIGAVVAAADAGLVVMHMRGTPKTMQTDTRYDDIAHRVAESLDASRRKALAAGCRPEAVAVDPGIGFGKSVEGNLELLARLDEIAALGSPVWVGPSRKSFLGHLLDAGPDERLAGTIAACLAAARNGAHVFRVHDVRAVSDALRTQRAIDDEPGTGWRAGETLTAAGVEG